MKTRTDLEYAKKYFEVLINTNTSNRKKAMLAYGQTLFIHKKYEESYKMANKLLKNDNNYVPAIFLQAKVKVVYKDYKEALKLLNKIKTKVHDNGYILQFIEEINEKIGNNNKVKIEELDNQLLGYLNSNTFYMAYSCCNKIEELGLSSESQKRRLFVDKLSKAADYISKKQMVAAYKIYLELLRRDLFPELVNSRIKGISAFLGPDRIKKIMEVKAAQQRLIGANLQLKIGSYDSALVEYKKLLVSNFYIKEALYGIFAIQLKTKKYTHLTKYLNNYKEYFTELEYYRLSTYYNINMSAEEKEKNQKNILRHILNRHEGDFYDYLDIEHIYYAIINSFENSSLTNANSFKYCISFDEPVACLDGEETNCIEVVSFIEKSNIITMYPVMRHGDVIKMKERVKKL